MLTNFLTHFNWLDAVLVLIIVRAIFIGAVKGLVVEFFKFAGMFAATIVTLHYYGPAGEAVHQAVKLPLIWAECFCFVVFWIGAVLIFKFIRDGWLLIMKMEAIPLLSKWGGGIVGTLRSFLISGMLLFLIGASENTVLNQYTESSLISPYLSDVSPRVYRASFEGVIVKFFPDEKLSEKVFPSPEKVNNLLKSPAHHQPLP